MNISVVIPTLNEIGNLPSCLKALSSQLNEGDEVIIVDGGSTDGTIEFAVNAGVTVYILEGSSIGMARHIGTIKSNNKVVASTDADAIPPNDWVSKIRGHFINDDDLDLVWGTIQDINGVPIRNIIGKFSTIIGGASGNNTAFRKGSYNEHIEMYPDISFAEDFAIIAKMAKEGKVKRDKSLVMRMNMERDRYQTKPLVLTGLATMFTGSQVKGKWGDIMKGGGASLIGTEVVYEKVHDQIGEYNEPHIHHDQVGAAMMLLGEHYESRKWTGAGVGVVAHHIATEGVSAIPSELQRNTDKIIEGVK